MIRRHRPVREIHFSFDSFLDVVANVVGIILRLILVAWMGARSYKGPPPAEMASLPAAQGEAIALPEPHDPLAEELDQGRQLLARAQKQLLQQLQEWQQTRKEREALTGQVTDLSARRQKLAKERQDVLEKVEEQRGRNTQELSLSLAEIQKRSQQLLSEIDVLNKQPSSKQVLRYRTPVSQPIQTDEVLFECQRGRVTLIDIGAFRSELNRDLRDKIERLRTEWIFEDVTQSIGAFRLRYVVERQRGALEGPAGANSPNARAGFSVSISQWTAEPVLPDRGETVEKALAAGSEFRRIVDNLDPNETVVTFWVYPDSFPQYRRLRDYLHEKDVVVAGRPLPEGAQIGGSPRGTASRGQ